MLGPGNETEARAALAAFPGGLQIGGGVNAQNARDWLDAGASHVIVTSWVFREGRVDWTRLDELVKTVGKDRLVLDLSCRKRGENYFVVTDRWQKFTELSRHAGNTCKSLPEVARNFWSTRWTWKVCAAALTANWSESLATGRRIPVTYAGGANSLADLEEVTRLGGGKLT